MPVLEHDIIGSTSLHSIKLFFSTRILKIINDMYGMLSLNVIFTSFLGLMNILITRETNINFSFLENLISYIRNNNLPKVYDPILTSHSLKPKVTNDVSKSH